MSVLSSTRGDPELLYSVLRLLQAAGRAMPTDELRDWVQPGLEKLSGSLLGDTLGVARSLGFVDNGKDLELLTEEPFDGIECLADRVHRRLSTCGGEDPDQVLYQTFAWFVIKCEQQQGKTDWIDAYSGAKDLADEVDAALRADQPERESTLFNASKFPSWKNWVHFTGLGCELPGARFYPFVYRRLKRELARLSGALGLDLQLEAETVLAAVAEAMPYLDGGRIFEEVSQKMKWVKSAGQVTQVLSTALRELHELQEIEMSSPGDVSGAMVLAPDRYSSLASVRWITLRRELCDEL